MPEKNPLCLFHANRLQFGQLEKELKNSKWIPRCNGHRLASAICSCRKNLDWKPDREELAKHLSCFRTLLGTQELKLSLHLFVFMKDILDSVTPADYSRCRLLKILFLAQQGDFSFLTRAGIRKNNMTDNIAKLKPKSTKLTKKQFDKMMRKKKRKWDSEVVELLILPGNIGKLETLLGSDLLTFSKQERFIYELKHQLNNNSFNNDVSKTFVEIWTRDPGNRKSVASYLRQAAVATEEMDDIKAKRAFSSLSDYTSCFLYGWMDDMAKEMIDEIYTPILVKERMSTEFELKAAKQKKCPGRKQVKKSVLSGGHCFHCLQAFTSLKNADGCKYHPGFVVCNKWTCCGEVINNEFGLESEHAETGCVQGRHNWRKHKKANRKPQRDDMFVKLDPLTDRIRILWQSGNVVDCSLS